MSPQTDRTALLRSSVAAFCDFFVHPPAGGDPLSYFISTTPRILEHGPAWATSRLPIIGHEYAGVSACRTYLSILADLLEFHLDENSFPHPDTFVVDPEARVDALDATKGESVPLTVQNALRGVVTVKAKATLKSKKTGQSWSEEIVWVISGFDEDGKFEKWEIWADPLSAYLAVGGQLDAVRAGTA